MDGIQYVNTGDWVESCAAVAENFDGRMEIIHWIEVAAVQPAKGFVPVVIDNDDLEEKAAAA
jgi:hypothetical protein